MLSNVSLTARTYVLAAICLQWDQYRVKQSDAKKDTHMCTTREHGRTTRMLKVGRHNGAHAEDREGRKEYKASKNRSNEVDIVSVRLYRLSALATSSRNIYGGRADGQQETHTLIHPEIPRPKGEVLSNQEDSLSQKEFAGRKSTWQKKKAGCRYKIRRARQRHSLVIPFFGKAENGGIVMDRIKIVGRWWKRLPWWRILEHAHVNAALVQGPPVSRLIVCHS
jgi:hypothetical protein